MTVNFPSGRSRSIPLRLFWRPPRISTQPRSGGAVTQGFSVFVEPTVDYPIARTRSQISDAKNGVAAVATPLCRRTNARYVKALVTATERRRYSELLPAEPLCDFLAFRQQSFRHIRL